MGDSSNIEVLFFGLSTNTNAHEPARGGHHGRACINRRREKLDELDAAQISEREPELRCLPLNLRFLSEGSNKSVIDQGISLEQYCQTHI